MEGAQQQEARRVAAVHRYHLLEQAPEGTQPGPPDAQIDALTRVAAVVAGVAIVTVSLIDAHRQCPLSTVGGPSVAFDRSVSLCDRHFRSGRTVHVPDMRQDPRYADSEWVDGRQARFRSYTSVPLVSPDGHALGTLCAIDDEPLQLGERQLAALQDVADAVVALFERRRESTLSGHLAAEAEEQRDLVELLMAEAEHRAELNAAVLASVDVGIVVTDPRGHLISFNDTARAWLGPLDAGLPPAEHAGAYGLFAADGRTLLTGPDLPLHRVLADGTVRDLEMVVRAGGRAPVAVSCSGRTITGDSGQVLGAVLALHDVTATRRREAALQAAHAQLEEAHTQLAAHTHQVQALAEAVRSIVTAPDPHQAVCRAALDLTGAEAAYLMQPDDHGHLVSTAMVGFPQGARLSLPMSGETGLPLCALRQGRQLFVADVAAHPQADPVMIAASGTVSGVWQPVLHPSGQVLGVLGVIWRRPVAELPPAVTAMLQTLAGEAAHTIERADLLTQLAQAAEHDSLTGLTNRRRWDEVARQEIARATRTGTDLTFALIDLDHFKAFNDTHGHLAGDRLLCGFATAAGAHLREVDTLARWGGEEFAVALPGCGAADAATVLERVRAGVPGGQSCTIGLAQWAPDESAEEVLARADRAMYQGKHSGRDRIVVAGS